MQSSEQCYARKLPDEQIEGDQRDFHNKHQHDDFDNSGKL
jgi:hypothetical protein